MKKYYNTQTRYYRYKVITVKGKDRRGVVRAASLTTATNRVKRIYKKPQKIRVFKSPAYKLST